MSLILALSQLLPVRTCTCWRGRDRSSADILHSPPPPSEELCTAHKESSEKNNSVSTLLCQQNPRGLCWPRDGKINRLFKNVMPAAEQSQEGHSKEDHQDLRECHAHSWSWEERHSRKGLSKTLGLFHAVFPQAPLSVLPIPTSAVALRD